MIQPTLPIHEQPRDADYFPEGDDGVPWTVKDWRGLSECFELEAHELEAWHADLAGQGRYWKIIKRIYGVMAVIGDAAEPEDSEDWTWEKLAKREGLPVQKLRDDLAEAVGWWKKLRLGRKIQRADAPAAGQVKPLDDGPRLQPHQELAEERISELLSAYRFDHIKSKPDRHFVANRLLELRVILEDKNRRESARQLINMELNLADFEANRALLKNRMDTLAKRTDLTDKESADVQGIQTALEKNEKAHTALTEKYIKAAAEIGEEEIEEGELRKVALGTASQFIEAQRQYHASGDRSLIDGMFTADELVWQTTPIPLRPSQYRLDLVLRVNEAMKPENLWDPDYKPTPIQREASRRMLKLSKLLADEEDAPYIPAIDEAPVSEDGEDLDLATSFNNEDPASLTAETSPPPEPPQKPDEEFMVLG